MLQTRAEILKKHMQLSANKKPRTLAVLPVRGKGFDAINFALWKLGDKELICWTIDAALDSELVDEIVVTTVDESLINFLKSKYTNTKITFILRDAKKFNKLESTSDLLLNVVKNKKDIELIVLLNQESPFRGHLYIDKAINTCTSFQFR